MTIIPQDPEPMPLALKLVLAAISGLALASFAVGFLLLTAGV